MRTVFFLLAVGICQLGSAQALIDTPNLKKAEVLFQKGEYSKALRLFEKEAFQQKSTIILRKAAECYALENKKSYCKYYPIVQDKGFVLAPEDLFFYGCDPKTYEPWD